MRKGLLGAGEPLGIASPEQMNAIKIEYELARLQGERALKKLSLKIDDRVKITGNIEVEGTVVGVRAIEPESKGDKGLYLNIALIRQPGQFGSSHEPVPIKMIEDGSVYIEKIV